MYICKILFFWGGGGGVVVNIVCSDKTISENEIQFNMETMTPRYIQCTIPSLLYQTRRKNPLGHNGLIWLLIYVKTW